MSMTDELRSYIARLLGWANTDAIDQALRSVDLARRHRTQLVICGQGDLVAVAHGLHRRAFGADAPFIVCDPRRGDTPASVRSPANVADVRAAFDAAAGGSLCVRRRRPPPNFEALAARLRSSDNVQYVCLDEDALQWMVRPSAIEIPPLALRAKELPRIVDEYVFDAVVELVPLPRPLTLTEHDRRWLIEHAAATSLSEIEKATRRLVALRSSVSVAHAASRLGMAAVSLSRWAARRSLPVTSETGCAA
jgi:hypothetical protein